MRRAVPYWQDAIVPDLKAEGAQGGAVLVVAHGNSLRAIRKYLEGIGDEEIVELEIPTGVPYRCLLDDELRVVEGGHTWGSRLERRDPRHRCARGRPSPARRCAPGPACPPE